MNEEMLEKLSVAGTPDDVQVIAKKYDIELSDEDAEKLFAEFEEMRKSSTDGKVSDEALAGVAGGYHYIKQDDRARFVYSSDPQGVIGHQSKLTDEERVCLKPYAPHDEIKF